MPPANSTTVAPTSSVKASDKTDAGSRSTSPSTSGGARSTDAPGTSQSPAPSGKPAEKPSGSSSPAPSKPASSSPASSSATPPDAKKEVPASSSPSPQPSGAPRPAPSPTASKPATGPNRGSSTTAKPSSSLALTLPSGLPSTAGSNWSYTNSNNITNINQTSVHTNVTNVTEVNVVNNYYTQVLPDGKTDTVTVPHLETRTRSVTQTFTKTPQPVTVTRTESGRVVTSTVLPSKNAGTTTLPASSPTTTPTAKPSDERGKPSPKPTPHEDKSKPSPTTAPKQTPAPQESGARSKGAGSGNPSPPPFSSPSPSPTPAPSGGAPGARVIPNATGSPPASSSPSPSSSASKDKPTSIGASSTAPSSGGTGNRQASGLDIGAQPLLSGGGTSSSLRTAVAPSVPSPPAAPAAPSAPPAPPAPAAPSAPSIPSDPSAADTGEDTNTTDTSDGPNISSASATSVATGLMPAPTTEPSLKSPLPSASIDPASTVSLAALSTALGPSGSATSLLISDTAPFMSALSSAGITSGMPSHTASPLVNLPTMAPTDADKKGKSDPPAPASTTSGVPQGMHRDAAGHLVSDNQSQVKASSANSTKATAGIVVGVIAGVALLAVALFFFLRYRRRRRQNRMPWSRDGGDADHWAQTAGTYEPYNYGTIGGATAGPYTDGGYGAASGDMRQLEGGPLATFTTRDSGTESEENIVSDAPIPGIARDPFHDRNAVPPPASRTVSFGATTTSSPPRMPIRTVGTGPAAVGYGRTSHERSGSSLSQHSMSSTSSGTQTVPALSDADYESVRGSLKGFAPVASASAVPLQAFQPRSVPKSLFVAKTASRSTSGSAGRPPVGGSTSGGALPYRSTGPGGLNLAPFAPNTSQRREREMRRISEATESVYSTASHDGNWEDGHAPPVPQIPSPHARRP